MTTPLSLSDLIAGLTVQQCTQSIYNTLARLGVDTTTWKVGSVVRTIVAANAIVLSPISNLVGKLAQLGFIQLSSGPWKTLCAKYLYGEDRGQATFAATNVTFTNAGGGIYNRPAGTVIVQNTTTGKRYQTTAALVLNGAGSVSVGVVALEAGSLSNAGPDTITTIISPSMRGVTCSNTLAAVASDDEKDAPLGQRCIQKLSTLSDNGPFGAYSYWAKNATRLDGTPIGVTRTRVIASIGDGAANMYVATDSGPVPGDVNDRGTDLGALYYWVFTHVCPPGGGLNVLSAVNVPFDTQIDVWIYSTVGKTEADIQANITLALQEYFAAAPIGGNQIPTNFTGGFIWADDVQGLIKDLYPDDVFHTIVSGANYGAELPLNSIPILGAVITNVNLTVRA